MTDDNKKVDAASADTKMEGDDETKEDAAMACPRSRGFNYGVGWGPTPKPAIYAQGEGLCKRLGQQAVVVSQAEWRVSMALRDLRLAETDAEKTAAVENLSEIVAFYDVGPYRNGK